MCQHGAEVREDCEEYFSFNLKFTQLLESYFYCNRVSVQTECIFGLYCSSWPCFSALLTFINRRLSGL